MPERNEDQSFLRDVERNAKGQFNSRAKQANIQGLNEYSKALRLNVADPIVQELQRLNQNLILPPNPVQRDTDLGGASQQGASGGRADRARRSSPTVTAGSSKGGIGEMKQACKMLLNGLDSLEDELAAERDVEDVVPSSARHAGVRGGSVITRTPT